MIFTIISQFLTYKKSMHMCMLTQPHTCIIPKERPQKEFSKYVPTSFDPTKFKKMCSHKIIQKCSKIYQYFPPYFLPQPFNLQDTFLPRCHSFLSVFLDFCSQILLFVVPHLNKWEIHFTNCTSQINFASSILENFFIIQSVYSMSGYFYSA